MSERKPQLRFHFTLKTAFVVATFAGLVFAIGRHLPVVTVFFGFVGFVVVMNYVLNMLGVYPKE